MVFLDKSLDGLQRFELDQYFKDAGEAAKKRAAERGKKAEAETKAEKPEAAKDGDANPDAKKEEKPDEKKPEPAKLRPRRCLPAPAPADHHARRRRPWRSPPPATASTSWAAAAMPRPCRASRGPAARPRRSVRRAASAVERGGRQDGQRLQGTASVVSYRAATRRP
jgi:membrane protein involved in colicin uptake